MEKPIRLALLASGSGTTCEQIFRACQKCGELFGLVEPVCLVISSADAGAINRLKNAGFAGEIYICNPKIVGKEKFADELISIFQKEKIDWFGQYGWLPLMPVEVIKKFHGINQHPAPVPFFGGRGMYGRTPHAAIINFRYLVGRPVKTEATAQIVAEKYDAGEIIATMLTEVRENDMVKSLQARVLPLEWKTQIEALKIISENNGEILPAKSNFTLLPGEEKILLKAKEQAIKSYPKG
ncbi:MAG: formyltransferase family protein [Candidatus Berkelbacteria bacterium]|nr:formyltransferase family protein [Candidatus Berkelbacteria bacterium]